MQKFLDMIRDRKNLKWVITAIAIIVVIIILIVIGIVKSGKNSNNANSSKPTTSQSSKIADNKNSSQSSSDDNDSSDSSSSTTDNKSTSKSVGHTKGKSGIKSTVGDEGNNNTTTNDADTPASIVKPDVNAVIASANSIIKSLNTEAQPSENVSGGSAAISIEDYNDIGTASNALAEKVKSILHYNDYSQSNSYNPVRFDYKYKIVSTGKDNGKSNFNLLYELPKLSDQYNDFTTDDIINKITQTLKGEGLKEDDSLHLDNNLEAEQILVPMWSYSSNKEFVAMTKNRALTFSESECLALCDGYKKFDIIYYSPAMSDSNTNDYNLNHETKLNSNQKNEYEKGFLFYLYLSK